MPAPVPPLTPYLFVSNAAAALKFYEAAFSGIPDGEPHFMPGTEKIMHARIIIHGGMIMLSDDFSKEMNLPTRTPGATCPSPVMLALEVEDARAVWDKAVAAGAPSPCPSPTPSGASYGQLADPFGHEWSVSQTLQTMTDEEMQASAEKSLAEKGTLMGDPAAA